MRAFGSLHRSQATPRTEAVDDMKAKVQVFPEEWRGLLEERLIKFRDEFLKKPSDYVMNHETKY